MLNSRIIFVLVPVVKLKVIMSMLIGGGKVPGAKVFFKQTLRKN